MNPEFSTPFRGPNYLHCTKGKPIADESTLLGGSTSIFYHPPNDGLCHTAKQQEVKAVKMSVQIETELFISAREGMAVYAQNPSYADVEGIELLVSVKDEGMLVDPKAGALVLQ